MKENSYGVHPQTEEELIEYLRQEEGKQHDYNTVAESLTNVTVAMFNYFASKQGMTGFQASWAGLQFLKVVRGLDAPFGIIDSSKMLYPQYDIKAEVDKWFEEWKPELGRIAKEKLEKDDGLVNPAVKERWLELAEYAPTIQ